MTDVETKPKPPDTPVKPQLSAKHMLAVTGAVAASVGGVVLLAAGGWIAVAGAGAAVVATSYGVHRVRHGNGKQSVIGQLLTRPRRTKTGGTLAWPFTGNQRGRALSRSSKTSGTSGGTRRNGSTALPKLPKLTTGARARHAASKTSGMKSAGTRRAASKSGSSTPRLHRSAATGSRPVPKTSGPKPRPGKPSGTKRPGTPTMTPRKPSVAPRLTGPAGSSRRANGKRSGAPGKISSFRRHGRAVSPWTGTKRSATRKPSARPSTTPSRKSSGTSRRTPKSFSGSPKTRKGNGTRRSSTPIRNPLRTTRKSGKLGGNAGSKRSTAPKRNGLRKAGRLGTPQFDRTKNPKSNRVPNRASKRQTARRAIPTNRKLVRQALRVPVVNKNRDGLKRPTKLQARKARRAIGLRTAILTGKATAAVMKAPHKLAAAGGRAWWDGLQGRTPGPIDPAWKIPTVPDPAMKATPGPKAPTGPQNPRPDGTRDNPLIPDAIVIPFPTDRRKEQIRMSARDSITDVMSSIASFEPQSGMEVARFMEEWGDLVNIMGEAFSTLADRMGNEMPIAAPVQDSVRDLSGGFFALSGVAQQAYATMLAAHEADIQRVENPRPGEELWDTGRE